MTNRTRGALAVAAMTLGLVAAAAPPAVAAAETVTICHATGSETNPFVIITVSVNAAAAHEAHDDSGQCGESE